MPSFLEQAIADAKQLRQVGLENAKEKLQEQFKDRLVQNFNHTINEMEETDDEDLDLNEILSLDEADEDESEEAPAETEDAGEDTDLDTPEEGGDEAGIDADPAAGEGAPDDDTTIAEMTPQAFIELVQSAFAGAVAKDANLDAQPDISDETDLDTGAEGIDAPTDPTLAAGEEEDVDLDEMELDELLAEAFGEDEEALNENAPKTSVPTDPNAKKLNEQLTKTKAELLEAKKAIAIYKQSLNEHAINQTKLQYLNRTLAENKLTDKQKVIIAGKYDLAKTKADAKFIYESVDSLLTVDGKQKSTVVNSKKRQLTESKTNPTIGRNQAPKLDDGMSRMLELAGITPRT